MKKSKANAEKFEIKYGDFGVNEKGTLGYISKEQAENKMASFTSDIFSLGVTLFELLVGQEDSTPSQDDDFITKYPVISKWDIDYTKHVVIFIINFFKWVVLEIFII